MTTACQASLSYTISWSLFKLMSIEKWCHLTNSCSVSILLPSSFTALGNFPMSWFFTSGGWGIGVSASASVQSHNSVQLFVTPWTAACQASLSITNSWSLLKLMSIKLVMPSNHLLICHPLFLPPSIFPSIRVFSSESVLRHQVAKVLDFQHQSFQWIFRTDFL